MREIFEKQLQIAETLDYGHTQFNFTMPIIRSILQYAAIGAYEKFDMVENLDSYEQATVVKRLRDLNDSAPGDVLSRLIPHMRCLTGHQKFCHGWFESYSEKFNVPLFRRIEQWVAFRNNVAGGHGSLALETVEKNLPDLFLLIKHIILVLSDALPTKKTEEDILYHTYANRQFGSSSLRIINDSPIIIRRIHRVKGIWFADYQVLDPIKEIEGRYELKESPILTSVESTGSRFSTVRIPVSPGTHKEGIWICDILLPSRQTPIFQGRKTELKALLKWYNDVGGSSMCLVRGDGGMGKTTLVLEFLNEILENPTSKLTYYPEVICFHTAKLIRWTPKGHVPVGVGGPQVVADALRTLVSCIETPNTRRWYTLDDRALIQKVAGLLHEIGLTRDNVLLVTQVSGFKMAKS